MAQPIQSFHPKVIIVEHFDELINLIDIKTETLLENENQISTEEKRNELNEAREKQLELIGEVKELNLSHLPQEFNEEKYREKWSDVIDDESLEYKDKIDKIKEDLILFDCTLMENHRVPTGYDLWVTSWYYNQRNLRFLR
jgi:hypothetical protein